MKFYTFEIVVEKEAEDKGYYVHSPTLPGCFSNGETSRRPDAICRRLSSNTSRRSWPTGSRSKKNEKLVHVEELTVDIP